ncbi:MAG: sigma-70 family RNA polymerase sigma factor [Verrucomicrobiales bacterium]|nr:sigma-70 family RNA polymerase sigma factor [Verrucomicrobiales bacterium]
MGVNDAELLRQYGSQGHEEAFAELVRRHLGMVTATAARIVKDPVAAEDVAQEVFARLARRWRKVPTSCALGGWLHQDTRWVALQYLRSERRRQLREQAAGQDDSAMKGEDPDWTRIRPLIDETLERLKSPDRDVVILRFFEQNSWVEVAGRLGVSEDAARMRVSRAIERLREQLRSRGVETTAGALGAALTAHGAVPVPAGVAQTMAGLAIASAGGSFGSSTVGGVASMLFMNKAAMVLTTVVITSMTTAIVLQRWNNHRMDEALNRWKARVAELEQRPSSPLEDGTRMKMEVDRNRRLSEEVLALKAELSALRASAAAAGPMAEPTDSPRRSADEEPAVAVTPTEIEQFLRKPPADQGRYLGKWRYPPGFQTHEAAAGTNAPAEFIKARELGGTIRQGLNALEDRPAEFADFQTAFIESVTGLTDPARTASVRKVIETAYDLAVSDGLTASKLPATGIEEWARRRDALDRWATKEVQAILSDGERQRFDQAFLGVLGIDLGLGDGAWYRFQGPNGSIVFPSEGDSVAPTK